VQAEVLPTWGDAVWDTSAVLSGYSVVGKILHALIGYVAELTGIQLVFYVATLLRIGALMQLFGRREPKRSTLAAIAIVIGLDAQIPARALADFTVRSPIVEYREI
jgi:high-affinity Fe2+/Pb2+ permease